MIFYSRKTVPTKSILSNPSVSVIVCARNEFDNLKNLIPILLNQQYPDYEVIIVNDRSSDASQDLLKDWNLKDNRLKFIEISDTPEGFNPKKYALSQGIEFAKNDFILLSDADCMPASSEWIDLMISQLSENQSIVLGFSPYQKQKSFLNQCIQYETFYTAVQYFSFALAGMPYMGVGRNLLYKKSLFTDNQGFNKHQKVTGGDDDLLIGRLANAENTTICLHPDAYVYSIPKKTWAGWYQQKIRHLSVSTYYPWKIKMALGILHLSKILFYFFAIYYLFYEGFSSHLALISFIIVINWILFGLINHQLKAQVNSYLLAFFDFLFGLYIFIVGFKATLGTRKIKWKN